MSQPFSTAADALQFIMGGNATVTLAGSQKNYTYKVSSPKDDDSIHFVSLLTGPDNTSDFEYLGFIRSKKMAAGTKGNASHPAYGAFKWTLRQLVAGKIPAPLEVWHEGRCGRCGRKLTVPSSIEAGFGPECASKL
jgi:hypothetical protein